MANNVTGFGAVVTIVASTTFPAGVPITQFADDSDPLDMASVQIADTAMGLNGDLVSWARANTLPVVLNVIPGSEDDLNLQILANANRVAQGKSSAYDDITLTAVYPDGSIVTFTGGVITDAMFGKSISSAGRIKTRSYAFKFEQQV
jgi:hypothetical protein